MSNTNEVDRLIEALAPVTGELRRVIDDATERLSRLHSVTQAFESAAIREENRGGSNALYHSHLYETLLMLMPDYSQVSDEVHRRLTVIDAELDRAEARTIQNKRTEGGDHAAHVSFADDVVSAGRWPAGARDLLVATLDHMEAAAGMALRAEIARLDMPVVPPTSAADQSAGVAGTCNATKATRRAALIAAPQKPAKARVQTTPAEGPQ